MKKGGKTEPVTWKWSRIRDLSWRTRETCRLEKLLGFFWQPNVMVHGFLTSFFLGIDWFDSWAFGLDWLETMNPTTVTYEYTSFISESSLIRSLGYTGACVVFKVVWKIITVVSYEEITYFGHRYRSKGPRQKKKKILPISVTSCPVERLFWTSRIVRGTLED